MLTYSNPPEDLKKRVFLSQNEKKFKIMIDLVHAKMRDDKNSELKYCAICNEIAETRAGAKLHKDCENVYTSKQLNGTI